MAKNFITLSFITLLFVFILLNNKLIIQWLKAIYTTPNSVVIAFPLAFNVVLGGSPILLSSYQTPIFGWDSISTTGARAVYFRKDYVCNYTVYGIFIGY